LTGYFKKDILIDKSWLTPPEDKIASEDIVDTLRMWADSMIQERDDPLEGLDFTNPAKNPQKIGAFKMLDPYSNLWGESFIVESVESDSHVTSESLSGFGDACEFKFGQGRGKITFENGDKYEGGFSKGRRLGHGKITFSTGPVKSLEGDYDNDHLFGKGKVEYRNGQVLHCFFEGSYLHGYSKLMTPSGKLLRVAKYVRGVLSGFQWNFLEGGGFLVGQA